MFRRRWAGLPKDAGFPSKLEELGYFVNDQDEVRSIESPDCYFKFFLDRNSRINDRQRFEFNHAVEEIVHKRLEREGLRKIALPLGTSTDEPHVSVFVSPDLKVKSRIIVIFGECTQDLGVLAGRIATGPGGIDQGSMVSVVQAIHKQASSYVDATPPGIVIANMGQLYWWPDANRAITVNGSSALPLPSLVHAGIQFHPGLNHIPNNTDPETHVRYVFNEMLVELSSEDAKLDIVAIGDSCEIVERFFDEEQNWAIWGGVINSMVLLGPVYTADCLQNREFLDFLAKRTRGYLVSPEPIDTPLAPPNGNHDMCISVLGCPCFSSSESQYAECIFIKAKDQILNYFQTVAMDPWFENAPITVVERPKEEFDMREWEKMHDDEKPQISKVDTGMIKMEMKQLKRWRHFEKTGVVLNTDSGSSSSSSE